MPRNYSSTEIYVGLAVGFVLTTGFSIAAWYFLTHDIREPQPHARFAAIWFSLMMATVGLSGLLRFVSLRLRWRWLSVAASLVWCAGFAMFALGFILAGIFDRDGIAGGIPLLPQSFNQALGAAVFIIAGVVIVAFLPKLYRFHQEHM